MKAKHLVLAGLTAALMLCVLAGLALAVGPTLHEATLNPQGSPYELNADSSGNLWISDYKAGEIWQVGTATGTYTVYQGFEMPSDAQAKAPGEIWWADGQNCALGQLFPSRSSVVTWTLGAGCVAQGIAFDDAGRVWISDAISTSVFSFRPADRQLCTYPLPASGTATYLAAANGKVWLGDMINGRLVAIDANAGQATSWQLPSPAGAWPYDLVWDNAGHLWWSDYLRLTLNAFEPATNRVTTYTLPAGSQPNMVTLSPRGVWYTADSNGTFGELIPGQAASLSSVLTPITETVSPVCNILPPAVEHAITTRTGAVSWAAGTYTPTATSGWREYQLPKGASPYGITFSGGSVWVTDRGRSTLVKVALPAEMFLPMLRR
jgi:streptogramin lyase